MIPKPEESQVFNFVISLKDLNEMITRTLHQSIDRALADNKEQIDKSIKGYFNKNIFDGKDSQFESALDWAVERSFREALDKAMEDLKFKDLIYKEAVSLLSSEDFLKEVAIKKLRSSFGLPSA